MKVKEAKQKIEKLQELADNAVSIINHCATVQNMSNNIDQLNKIAAFENDMNMTMAIDIFANEVKETTDFVINFLQKKIDETDIEYDM